MSDAQTVAHENNMAACSFGTDLSADFDRIFVIFALEMHFQRFFRWEMENWVHLHPKNDIVTVRMMNFYARNQRNKDFRNRK